MYTKIFNKTITDKKATRKINFVVLRGYTITKNKNKSIDIYLQEI